MSIFKPLSGESEARTTPETLSSVCSGASAATGYLDTTPRMATTVASAPVLEELPKKPTHTSFVMFFQSKFATINPWSLTSSINTAQNKSGNLCDHASFVLQTLHALTPCHHAPCVITTFLHSFFPAMGTKDLDRLWRKRWCSKFNGRCILDIQTMMD